MSTRLKVATVLFALLALIEVADTIRLVLTLGNPAPVAAQLGIKPNAVYVRAIVLLLLAIQIALGSIIAVSGLVRRRWVSFRLGALVASVGCVIYGSFQLVSALLQLKSIAFAALGLAFLAVGLLAYWLARSPVAPAGDRLPAGGSQ
jgi:hypothetical protein